MKLPFKLAFGAGLLALSLHTLAAVHAPHPDLQQGDGRVSPFYIWQQVIPEQPGKLLRSEPLPVQLSLGRGRSPTTHSLQLHQRH